MPATAGKDKYKNINKNNHIYKCKNKGQHRRAGKIRKSLSLHPDALLRYIVTAV